MASGAYPFRIQTARFDAFCDELLRGLSPAQREKLVRALGLKFISLVAPETPVDTGRARAGWAAFADANGVPLSLPGRDDGAKAKGRSEGRYELVSARQSTYLRIRNAVPYIVALEFGHSDQAPAGFVRVALRRMRTGVRGEALKALKDRIAAANVRARAARLKG